MIALDWNIVLPALIAATPPTLAWLTSRHRVTATAQRVTEEHFAALYKEARQQLEDARRSVNDCRNECGSLRLELDQTRIENAELRDEVAAVRRELVEEREQRQGLQWVVDQLRKGIDPGRGSRKSGRGDQ